MSYLTNQILRGAETIRRNSSESNKNTDSGFNKNMTTDTPRTDACPHCGAEESRIKFSLRTLQTLVMSLTDRAEKAEAEVERLNGLLSDLLILTEKIYWNSNNYKMIKEAHRDCK